jgi:hypothetical protein
MVLKDELSKLGDKNIRVYLDMDGTIVHYDVGNADNYDVKRPLTNRINKVKDIINSMPNVTFYILSIGHEQKHVDQKNEWLDKYLPEIPKDNRVILIRNIHSQITSADIKKNYINNIKTDDTIVLIDDDPRILGSLNKDNKNNAIILKDCILSD